MKEFSREREEKDFIKLSFSSGTLVLAPSKNELPPVLAHLAVKDERIGLYRASASDYAGILRICGACGIEVEDSAREYKKLPLKLHSSHTPRAHQKKALENWKKNKGRGIVAMPTGSGKTFLAALAMASIERSTLVVVPTIDLLIQWEKILREFFRREVGMLGGGSHEIRDITVATYDSAVLNMEFIGNKFGLAIYDECHHLPGEVNRKSASMCLAPYRLGLSATPEREDDGFTVMEKLLGPLVCRIHIHELEGSVLSPYITRRIPVRLAPEEQERYASARKTYVNFIRRHNIDFSAKDAWSSFIIRAVRAPGGREALKGYLEQRGIARYGKSKLAAVWKILRNNPGERIIVFTADNEAAYAMGECFMLPVITHRTKAAERKEFLEKFRSGEYPVLLTSKVLNEGVDVPEASIGIVVSGSGSTREHVQRLGRILRAKEGKQAILYELVSDGTSEMSVSFRRRQHRAYGNFQYNEVPVKEIPEENPVDEKEENS